MPTSSYHLRREVRGLADQRVDPAAPDIAEQRDPIPRAFDGMRRCILVNTDP